jgi:hypothetical protein
MTRGLPASSLGDAEGAGVLAVGGAEGVVDVNIAEAGQLGRSWGRFFLFFVEAEIFQE